jgi:hypothetical protein
VQKHLAGPLYVVLGQLLSGLTDRGITVPGSFKGGSKISAVRCSYNAGMVVVQIHI